MKSPKISQKNMKSLKNPWASHKITIKSNEITMKSIRNSLWSLHFPGHRRTSAVMAQAICPLSKAGRPGELAVSKAAPQRRWMYSPWIIICGATHIYIYIIYIYTIYIYIYMVYIYIYIWCIYIYIWYIYIYIVIVNASDIKYGLYIYSI